MSPRSAGLASKRLAFLLGAAMLGAAGDARAAGLYFSDRGVKPLGRGGAYVAGADDLGAIWYNPAGLADAGTSIMADFSWLHFTSEFTRQTNVTDANGVVRTYTYPTVNGTSPILPIPTIGGTFAFGDQKQFTAAFGIYAPYTAITSYPIAINGDPAPSRYSLVSLDGSLLVGTGLWLAYKPIEQIRFGVGLQALVGTFASSTMFSASPPDRLIGAPEDPKYDSLAQLNVGPIFAPSANLGVTAVPEKHIRVGISYQLPYLVNAPGTIQVRLPNAVEFDDAKQIGKDVHVRFELPAIFRAGVEVRPTDQLKVEVAYVREFWTTHHAIEVSPDNVRLSGVTGFPNDFRVANISLPRNFENTNSVRLGGELAIPVKDYVIDVRLGFNYEQSAIPPSYLSPLTIDLDKYAATIGGSLHVGPHWRLDAVYAHIFTSDQTVSPSEAAIPRVNPVRGNPTAGEAINGGTYSARADVLGVGVNYKF